MNRVPVPSVFPQATTHGVVACVIVAVLSAAGPVRAQTAAVDSAVQHCTAADTSTQWKAVAAAWAAHQGEPAADDSLRRRLLELGQRDQAVRMVPGLLDSGIQQDEDRVFTNAGKPQLYGTQLGLAAGDSALVFDSIADLVHLARRRAAAGLPPLDVYICMVRGMYGHDVVDPRATPTRKPPR